MKIISKYKDYYDYLKGIYGEDNKLVLDRRDGFVVPDYFFEMKPFSLIICDTVIEGFGYKGKPYYGKELESIGFVLRQDKNWRTNVSTPVYVDTFKSKSVYVCDYKVVAEPYIVKGSSAKQKCPIVLKTGNDKYEPYPRLSDFNIHKIFTPQEMWIKLTTWLASQVIEPEMPVGSDEVRIAQHGFSVKESFRPKMKNSK